MGDGLADEGVGVRHSAAILSLDLGQVNECELFELFLRVVPRVVPNCPSMVSPWTNRALLPSCCYLREAAIRFSLRDQELTLRGSL